MNAFQCRAVDWCGERCQRFVIHIGNHRAYLKDADMIMEWNG